MWTWLLLTAIRENHSWHSKNWSYNTLTWKGMPKLYISSDETSKNSVAAKLNINGCKGTMQNRQVEQKTGPIESTFETIGKTLHNSFLDYSRRIGQITKTGSASSLDSGTCLLGLFWRSCWCFRFFPSSCLLCRSSFLRSRTSCSSAS